MDHGKLAGIMPTARLSLELLLGPGSEPVAIYVEVFGADERRTAMRCFPLSKQCALGTELDAAWRVLLNAIPHDAYMYQRQHNDKQKRS